MQRVKIEPLTLEQIQRCYLQMQITDNGSLTSGAKTKYHDVLCLLVASLSGVNNEMV